MTKQNITMTQGELPSSLAIARHPPSEYVYGRRPRKGWLGRSAAAAAGALVLGGLAAAGVAHWQRKHAERRGETPADSPPDAAAAQRFYQGAALLSLSVLADSSLEHYRGGFKNRAMFIAPTAAAVTFVTSLASGAHPRGRGITRTSVFGGAIITGILGTGFHIYNIRKREGGFNWSNLFYAAPLGAPGAIAAAGVLGLAARRIVRPGGSRALIPAVSGHLRTPAGPALGAFTSVGLLATSAEVTLLHFRGTFQNPFMYIPVTVPPLAAVAMGVAASAPSPATARATRTLLATTAAIGLAGVGFHAHGIARNMGGWRNWSQMILQGPPLPAPPSFTGMALAGLGALRLIEEER